MAQNRSPAVASPTATATEATGLSPAQLSPAQITQLTQLRIEIVLPTYVPPGFRVSGFEAHQQQDPNDRQDYSYYTVSYSGPNNTCIEAGSGYQSVLISSPITTRQVETHLGAVRVDSGRYRTSEVMQYWGIVGRHNTAVFTGGKLSSSPQLCSPVSFAEYTKVLQSLRML